MKYEHLPLVCSDSGTYTLIQSVRGEQRLHAADFRSLGNVPPEKSDWIAG